VRTIDADGKQLGIIPTSQALATAQQRGMDLVEVAPNATPPVCRIMDYGKYKYEQEKRDREARKHQQGTKIKEIKLRVSIDPHDYQIKLNHMRAFLTDNIRVKVSLFFRGRENAHPEAGERLMQQVIADLQGCGRAELPPRQIGRSIHMLLAPVRGAGAKKPNPEQRTD
jgi:translation initiation factor IF-3